VQRFSVEDFPVLDFGDKRRGKRLVKMINNICEHPGSSIPAQNARWYDTKATYNFYNEEDISLEALQNALSAHGAARLGSEIKKVFVAHDISTIAYNHLKAKGTGVGHTGNKNGKGIMCFSSLAISEEGTPLELLYQHSWTRHELGKAKKRKSLPFEQKESFNWYRAVTEVGKLLCEQLHCIHLADREADIYELFCTRCPGRDFLIRATHNRALEEGGILWKHVAEQPSVATVQLEIPDSRGRKTTPVEAEVRFMKVSIRRPSTSKNECKAIEVTAVEVRQIGEKLPGQKALIHWKLLTSLEVGSVVEAVQCVKWYCYRWLIERFHYVLKSGTEVESLQFEEAESLQKAIHVHSMAAVRIMQLVYQSRQTPDVSCEMVLSKEQWTVLHMLIHKDSKLPKEPPTLKQAAYWVGRLGGHLGRKLDGPPGPKAIWTGYNKLCNAVQLYHIINPPNLGKA
jgi:hypothetical protein